MTATCNNSFWNDMATIPVWNKEGNEMVCKDVKTGNILNRCKVPLLPNGESLQMFTPYEAILVNDIEVESDYFPGYLSADNYQSVPNEYDDMVYTVTKGTTVYIGMMPNATFYLARKKVHCPSIGGDINLSDISLK